MKEQIHTKCLLLIIINELLPSWKQMHKEDMGENKKWDKHSDNTRLLTFNTQHSDCRHRSSFFTHYCSPVQQEEMWITKKKHDFKKKNKKKTCPLENRTNSHFRTVTKRFLFLLNIMFIESKQFPFGSSLNLWSFEQITRDCSETGKL